MNYGRYRVERELGRGAMGVVHQAHDPQIDRTVALKVLRPDLVTSEDFVKRFLKEAKAIGRLSSPNIVTIYDVGQDHGTIYIAMEFLPGESLDAVIKRKEFSQEEIVQVGIQVAGVLSYAHQNGIVHRDIKPSNIVVSPDGTLKITDFGIAQVEDPAAPQLTRAGEILGTPAYMAPEQVLGRQVDGRSDIYSLGVILYELSTGTKPFKGRNLTAIFRAVLHDIPPEPSQVNSRISPGLSRVIAKCLNKAPEARFQTGKDLSQALERCLKGSAFPYPARTPRKISRSLPLFVAIAFLTVGIVGLVSNYLINRKPAEVTTPAPVKKSTPAVRSPNKEPVPSVQAPSEVQEARRAVLKVMTKPSGAKVFVDGGFKGTAPLKLQLPPGTYGVRLTMDNHYDWEAKVHLKEKRETPLLVRLIPMD